MGYAMTGVVGLVLVAMTGLTITNHRMAQQRNQDTATGGSTLSPAPVTESDPWLQSEAARELEKALDREDAALWASYERFKKHPRSQKLRQQMGEGKGAGSAVDPLVLVNSVYSLNTRAELVADDDRREFLVRDGQPGAATGTADGLPSMATRQNKRSTGDGSGGGAGGDQVDGDAERPFDFYDPTLTVMQKRDYVKKVEHFLHLLRCC